MEINYIPFDHFSLEVFISCDTARSTMVCSSRWEVFWNKLLDIPVVISVIHASRGRKCSRNTNGKTKLTVNIMWRLGRPVLWLYCLCRLWEFLYLRRYMTLVRKSIRQYLLPNTTDRMQFALELFSMNTPSVQI